MVKALGRIFPELLPSHLTEKETEALQDSVTCQKPQGNQFQAPGQHVTQTLMLKWSLAALIASGCVRHGVA